MISSMNLIGSLLILVRDVYFGGIVADRPSLYLLADALLHVPLGDEEFEVFEGGFLFFFRTISHRIIIP